MKKILLFVIFPLLVSQQISAQVSADNLSSLFADGYTINEMETIFKSITPKNYKKWLRSNKFEYVKEFESGLVYYKKNEVVSLGIFVKKERNVISEIFFHSSPQKFYKARSAFEEDASFKAIAGKGSEKKWYRNGFVYFADDDEYNIGIYRDVNNEAATSPKSTAATTKATSGNSNAFKSPSPKYDLSTAQKFADILNANLNRAYISARGTYSVYDFTVLGKTDLTKRSLSFIAKEGELYVKMNIPMNGECDYGLKTEKARFINNCTLGLDKLCKQLKYEYTCNEKLFKDIIVAFPRTKEDDKQEYLFQAIVAKFRECCK